MMQNSAPSTSSISVLNRDPPSSAARRAIWNAIRSSSAPAQTPIVASTAKSRAATRPASARGSVANRSGAATKPIAPTSPAHAPASQAATRRGVGLTRSLVADARDLVALDAARRLHLGDVALDLADQCAR